MKQKIIIFLTIYLLFSSALSAQNNDFLNNYYFDQIPLPNNTFSLVLSKLVYGDKRIVGQDRYNDDYNGAVERLPEILDSNAFTYWGVKPNVMIKSGTNIISYLSSNNSDYFNSKLPKIEVLKNKLFTIKYNDGSEESFLFNVKKIESEDNNNQRKILQIELANEEVKEDGSNNTAKDIVWRIFAIENECYLALTLDQLNRLKVKLFSLEKLDVYCGQVAGEMLVQLNDQYENMEKVYYFETTGHIEDYNGKYLNYIDEKNTSTSGKGIYLSRNKDLYMDSSKYINPQEIIYLFKLK